MGCACSKTSAEIDIRERYKIGVVLGSGSFGQVRSCIKKSTNEVFAVKVMSKEPPKDKQGCSNVDFALMFRNEVSLLSTLEHPHIIKVHEFYEDKHFLYAIMDKCEGGELFSHIVKRRRFSEAATVTLCRQMLQAISYIHGCGIVHRDVKAENFLFYDRSANSRLILIDFGMSTRIPDDRHLKQLCGSPHYVAPELIRRNYRFKVDMWALGVVIFLMLYGKYPFDGADQKAIVHAILNGQADYRRGGNTPVSKLAIAFISALLERDPDVRLSANEALQHPWLTGRGRADDVGKVEEPSTVFDAQSVRVRRVTPPQTEMGSVPEVRTHRFQFAAASDGSPSAVSRPETG